LLGHLRCLWEGGHRAHQFLEYARLDSNQRTVFTQSLGIVPRFALPTPVGSRWAGIVPASFWSTPGWTRTSDPGIRNLRRDDFASPEETTKCDVSRCRSTTSESMSDFTSSASFTAHSAEKGTDLRNPQINIGHPNASDPRPPKALKAHQAGPPREELHARAEAGGVVGADPSVPVRPAPPRPAKKAPRVGSFQTAVLQG
jgi:hypothetical protein